MDLQLGGKRALVTGGSRGIGLQIARGLLAEGTDVAIAARDSERLAKATAELTGLGGGRVVAVQIETGDDASVRAAVAAVHEQLGGVDILVNNAATPGGQGQSVPPSQVTDEQFVDAVNVKVLGYLRTVRAVVPGMIDRGWGRIINISGLAARTSGDFVATARNIGVAALTKNLADELGRHGINVTVVHPGATVTERTPQLVEAAAQAWGLDPEATAERLSANTAIGRSVTAEEVAAVVTFLASPRSVAITGDAVVVSGGSVGAIHY